MYKIKALAILEKNKAEMRTQFKVGQKVERETI